MRHFGPISGLAVHGKYVASAGYDNQLILWDTDRGEGIARGLHDHLVNNCSFSHNGRLLVSASSDYTARVWDVPTMRLRAVLSEHDDDVDMAIFAPDDRFIATCALDRSVRVFDRAGHCRKLFRGHTGNVLSLAWRADGGRVVSSSVDGTVRDWDVAGDTSPRVYDLGMRTDTLVMHSSGRIYAGDDNGRIARIENGSVSYVQAHRVGVKKLVYDETLNTIVTLSYDRSLAVWKLDEAGTPSETHRTECPSQVWARSAAILPDSRIAVGTFGGRYAVYDCANDRWDLENVEAGVAIDAMLTVDGAVYTVGDAGHVYADGRLVARMGSLCNFLLHAGDRLITGGQLGELYDARTGNVLFTHHSPLNCGVSFRRGNSVEFLVGTYTGELLHFRADDTERLSHVATIPVFRNAVKAIVADDSEIFTVCANTSIARFDIATMEKTGYRERAHERIANACCAIGNRAFASIGRDRILRLWTPDGDETYPSPHRNSVKCMAISSDRRFVMTGSYRGTTAAFDLYNREWLPAKQPTAAGISAMAWDERRSCFLAASYDGHVYALAS